MAYRGDPRLCVPVHDLAVEIDLRRVFADQFAVLLQLVEVPPRLRVDVRPVRIDPFRHGGFRAHDTKEAMRLGGDDVPCLGRVEHVIRRGSQFRGQIGARDQSLKSTNTHGVAKSNRSRGG